MQSLSDNAGLKEQRVKAFLPFAFFVIAFLGMYMLAKVEMANRPAPRPATDAQQQAAQQEAPPMQGKTAPAFTLESLSGGQVSLADHKGKMLFINLWATWCEPCREEMPSMQRLYDTLKGPDFEMLAISLDQEGRSAVEPYIKEMGLTFPVLLDPANKTYNDYKATGVPETYIVDPMGTVIHHHVGPFQWDRQDVVDALQGYIQQTAAIKQQMQDGATPAK